MLSFITACSQDYYSRFMAYYRSIRTFYPESPIYLTGYGSLAERPEDVIYYEHTQHESNLQAASIGITRALHLFEQGVDSLIMCGSDVELFSRMTEVEELLKTYDVIITSHMAQPMKGDQLPLASLYRTGIANGEFCAVRNTENGMKFLRWYEEVVRKYHNNDVPNGIFFNQIWLTMTPFLFEGVSILHHKGYNAAYWNIEEYGLEYRDGVYYVAGEPLRFFHYSGFVPGNPARRCKYFNLPPATGDILKIYLEYDRKLRMR